MQLERVVRDHYKTHKQLLFYVLWAVFVAVVAINWDSGRADTKREAIAITSYLFVLPVCFFRKYI